MDSDFQSPEDGETGPKDSYGSRGELMLKVLAFHCCIYDRHFKKRKKNSAPLSASAPLR